MGEGKGPDVLDVMIAVVLVVVGMPLAMSGLLIFIGAPMVMMGIELLTARSR